jgi:hypothetical protein
MIPECACTSDEECANQPQAASPQEGSTFHMAAYLQQQDEASLMAFSTASRVSPVRF